MSKLFNGLVIVVLLITVSMWLTIPYIEKYWLSDQAMDLVSANGWGALVSVPTIFYWPILGYWIAVSVGLLLRIKPARTAYVVGLVVFSIVDLVSGFVVLLPFEAGLVGITSLLDGAIVAIAYFTSVEREFR